MLSLICLLSSEGSAFRVPVPEFLERLVDDDVVGERQSAAATERLLSVFAISFLVSLVNNLVVLYREQVTNTATTGLQFTCLQCTGQCTCLSPKQNEKYINLLVSVSSVDLESQVAATVALIEEVKAEIVALEARKEAVNEISDKITKVTSRNYVKRIISRQQTFTHSCSQFTALCQDGLTAVQNGDDNMDILKEEILGAVVEPCSAQDIEALQIVAEEAAKTNTDLVNDIFNKNETLQILEDKLEELFASTTTPISATTTTTTNSPSSTTTSSATAPTSTATSNNGKNITNMS